MESTITSKGQATIPKFVREHLGLKPRDRIKFFVHPDGSVVLLPKRPASALRGIVKASRRPVSLEGMHAAAAAGAARTCAAGGPDLGEPGKRNRSKHLVNDSRAPHPASLQAGID